MLTTFFPENMDDAGKPSAASGDIKNRYPKWNPSKWKHGPKPAVPWWLNFDPYPYRSSFLLRECQGKPIIVDGREVKDEKSAEPLV